jgi:hypothetical protein
MTALSPSAVPPFTAPVEAPPFIRWKERDFIFELACRDARLLELARAVFPTRPVAADAAPAMRWEIDLDLEPTGFVAEMQPSERIKGEILRVEWDVIHFLVEKGGSTLSVHAAVLSKDGKGVVIIGPSFAGKSTLATGLWRNGWSLLSDDLVFLDADQRMAFPAPRRVSLRNESRGIVGEALWNEIAATESCVRTHKGLFFHPHEVVGSERLESTPVNAIFFLARREAKLGSAEKIRLNPAKSALALLPYAFNIRELPFIEGMEKLRPICENIPTYDLGRGELGEMIRAVESAVD